MAYQTPLLDFFIKIFKLKIVVEVHEKLAGGPKFLSNVFSFSSCLHAVEQLKFSLGEL